MTAYETKYGWAITTTGAHLVGKCAALGIEVEAYGAAELFKKIQRAEAVASEGSD